jgi:hypothetical protein
MLWLDAHMAERSNAYRVVVGKRELTSTGGVFFLCYVLQHGVSNRMLRRLQAWYVINLPFSKTR